jgi:hypothetical protein
MQSNGELIGPVVEVWCKEPASGGMLENSTVRYVGDRSFIVGTLVPHSDGPHDPRIGLEFWFPVDDVLMLTVHPSVASAQEVHRKREERKQAAVPTRKGWFG